MLRAVKAAQLMYLSDNPSTAVTSLTSGTSFALYAERHLADLTFAQWRCTDD